jgi:predicted small lipoprotein YifL
MKRLIDIMLTLAAAATMLTLTNCGLLELPQKSAASAPQLNQAADPNKPRRLEYCVDSSYASPDTPTLSELMPEIKTRLQSHDYVVFGASDSHLGIELPAGALPFDDDQAAAEVAKVIRRHKGPRLIACRTEHYEN